MKTLWFRRAFGSSIRVSCQICDTPDDATLRAHSPNTEFFKVTGIPETVSDSTVAERVRFTSFCGMDDTVSFLEIPWSEYESLKPNHERLLLSKEIRLYGRFA